MSNATDIAAAHGLRLDNWLRNKETEAYIDALGRHLNTSDSMDLIRGMRSKHKSVIQLIRQRLGALEEFGTLAFEMRKSGVLIGTLC